MTGPRPPLILKEITRLIFQTLYANRYGSYPVSSFFSSKFCCLYKGCLINEHLWFVAIILHLEVFCVTWKAAMLFAGVLYCLLYKLGYSLYKCSSFVWQIR